MLLTACCELPFHGKNTVSFRSLTKYNKIIVLQNKQEWTYQNLNEYFEGSRLRQDSYRRQ